MILLCILSIPLLFTLAPFFVKELRSLGRLNAIGHLAVLVAVFYFALTTTLPVKFFDFFYVDALSVFFLFVISVVTFAASLFSIDYINEDASSGFISERKAKLYYVLFNFFSFSMLLVPMVSNLGMVWVGIELTTLASAFLVGFYNNKTSIGLPGNILLFVRSVLFLHCLGRRYFIMPYPRQRQKRLIGMK